MYIIGDNQRKVHYLARQAGQAEIPRPTWQWQTPLCLGQILSKYFQKIWVWATLRLQRGHPPCSRRSRYSWQHTRHIFTPIFRKMLLFLPLISFPEFDKFRNPVLLGRLVNKGRTPRPYLRSSKYLNFILINIKGTVHHEILGHEF